MATRSAFRWVDVPLEEDRTKGFRFIREHGDVFQAADGAWVLASAEAVQFAQQHPEIFSSVDATSNGLGLPLRLIPVSIDPPAHGKYRRVLDPMFAPRIVNAMEDDLRVQVRELVAAFAAKGECDVVADVARLFPTQVFLTFFGMRLADRDQLIGWVETILEHSTTGVAQASPEVIRAGTELFHYMQRYIDEKRGNRGNDVLSQVMALEGEDAWTNEELLGFCFLFTLAGLDTVAGAIGFVMLYLARNPALRRRMLAEPRVLGRVIEEVLRLEPPAPHTTRVTIQDVEVGGAFIPAGSPILLLLATANRDHEDYDRLDDLDVDRTGPPHLTFGGGIHRCLGSHLARRELRLVVEEFHKRIPEYELAPGFEPKVVWPASTLHLARLPLVFPPDAKGGSPS